MRRDVALRSFFDGGNAAVASKFSNRQNHAASKTLPRKRGIHTGLTENNSMINLRRYLGVMPLLFMLAGVFLLEGLQSWHRGDSNYWTAMVFFGLSIGVGYYLRRKVWTEIVQLSSKSSS
jgi:hypothetical protein